MNNRLGYFIAGTVVAGVMIFGVAILVQQNSGSASGPCVETGAKHEVVINDSKVDHVQTEAQRCDVLVITNKDTATRILAFGYHDRHVAYNGIEERELKRNESVTVTLEKTGSFHFHDHLHDEVEGFFTVTK